MGDQAFWGHRIKSLGVGPQPIPRKQLTVKRLANAIERVVSDTIMQQKAHLVGKQISDENGVNNAVHIVDKIIDQSNL